LSVDFLYQVADIVIAAQFLFGIVRKGQEKVPRGAPPPPPPPLGGIKFSEGMPVLNLK
jgi:hypothetical protein